MLTKDFFKDTKEVLRLLDQLKKLQELFNNYEDKNDERSIRLRTKY